ncbi:MAG: hypothetical protein JRH19_26075 [Deltaproteobacteria bacterium]|nr:hypothetical protein [Deltaproteobacteria bacterium]
MQASRMALLLLAAFSLLVVAAACSAQVEEKEKESVEFAVTGEVRAVEVEEKVLVVSGANNDGGVFLLDDKTTIKSGAKKIKLEQLQKGMQVAVDAKIKDGKLIATYVEVVVDDKTDKK